MKDLTFRLVATTIAAGKYNPGAPLDGNEDAMYVNLDVSGKLNPTTEPDTLINLGSAGCLMVVADGMGGMNAGEVASACAISTVQDSFVAERITPEILKSPETRAQYMIEVARTANTNILADAANNPSRSGMGSTLLMAWLMPSGELTVCWIGDSRAYVYNPSIGIHPLSEDQSFVQQLVRKGIITYEQSFDHPQNNIITRSLGDPQHPCEPEIRQFNVGRGDLLLICSDGLTGVLRDRPGTDPVTGKAYPDQNLQDILSANQKSVALASNALLLAAENSHWYDNITLILCRIVDGPASRVGTQTARLEKQMAKDIKKSKAEIAKSATTASKNRKAIILGLIVLIIIGLCCWLGFFFLSDKEEQRQDASTEQSEAFSSSEEAQENVDATPINQPKAIEGPAKESTKTIPATPSAPNPASKTSAPKPGSTQGNQGNTQPAKTTPSSVQPNSGSTQGQQRSSLTPDQTGIESGPSFEQGNEK